MKFWGSMLSYVTLKANVIWGQELEEVPLDITELSNVNRVAVWNYIHV